MRTARARIKHIDRGMLTGQGKTLTEARADLGAQTDAALEGSYEPAIVTLDAYSAVVYRTPRGWEYRLHCADRPLAPEGINDVYGTSILGNCSRAEAIQQASGHIVNLSPTDYHTVADLPAWLTDKTEQDNVLHCCRFRRAYRWAEANRIGNSHQCHEWTGWNMQDPRFD